MKRRNGEKEKKKRDDCMIIVSVQLREREKGQRRKKWKGGERQMPS